MGTGHIISVFLHIVFASFWIGGMLFLPLVILPGVKTNPNKIKILYQTGIKFRFYGWIALSGLLATGLFNMYSKGYPFSFPFLLSNPFGKLLGYKLLLFSIIIIIGAIHDFYIGGKAINQMEHANTGKLKHLARWSGRINLILSLTIAFLGVALSRGGI